MFFEIKVLILNCYEIHVLLDRARVNFTFGEPTNFATFEIIHELETIHILYLESVFHNDDVHFTHTLAIDCEYSNYLHN